MGDAVIVSAGPHRHRHRPQGHAARRQRVRPRQVRGRRGAEALGHRRRPTSTTSRWASRSRAAATSPATPRSSSASSRCPASRSTATARRAWPRCRARPAASWPAWTRSSSPAARSRISTSPQLDEAHAGHRRHGAVDVAEPPRDARRARVRHVDHRRLEHRAEGRTSPARRWTTGRTSRTSAPSRAIDEGRFEEEIFPIEVKLRDGTTKIVRGRRAPAPRRRTMEKLASLKPLHPEIEGFSITAGNSSGLNDGAAAMVIVDGDYAKAHGLEPLGRSSSWASAGLPPERHGPRPDRRDPEGARARGPVDRRRRPRRDQRGVRVDVRRGDAACSASRTRSPTSTAAAASSATRSRHRRPHDRHARCTSCAAAAAASASRACAPAAAWAPRPSSRS